MNPPNLHGRTALVTGGGRGIGRATAYELALAGATVVVNARTTSEIDQVAQEIKAGGGEALAVNADVSNPDDVQRMFHTVGPVDILINSAGVISPIATVVDADPTDWLLDIAINLNGVFLTCHFALSTMLEKAWGRIINVSSGAARGTTTGWSAYSASKAGVEAFTKVLAHEVADGGVRANAVRPGIVDTSMQVEIRAANTEQMGSLNVEKYRRYKNEGMLRDPRDPARLILWLLSSEAEDLNGEVLAIDDPETAAKIGLTPVAR